MWYVTGFEVPLLPPPVLTPPHAGRKISARIAISNENTLFPLLALNFFGDLKAASTSPGNASQSPTKNQRERVASSAVDWRAAATVEMLMTTSTAELPGVTAVAGLNLHWPCGGRPAAHARVTAPVKNEPTGCTVKL